MMFEQPDNLPDDQIEVWQQAAESFNRAYRLHVQGDLASAMRAYRLSLRLYPTAEAHTFLGWVYATLHLYDAAIEECRRAIAVDPSFGNPYNDIGAYLIDLERPGEALPWLEQAVVAPRYTARVLAYFNLGRAHERLGHWAEAVEAYRTAMRTDPGYQPATAAWQRLVGKAN